jgi:NitT/TauT family transport system substrate-binding protein
VLLKAALKKQGIDESQINFVTVPPGADVNLLREGKVDAMAGYVGAQAIWLTCSGTPAGDISLVDALPDIYGQTIFANNAWLAEAGPDGAGRVLTGIFQGMTLVKSEFERGVEILIKTNPEAKIDRAEQLSWAPHQHVQLVGGPDVAQHGVGWIDPAKVKRTADVFTEIGTLQAPGDLSRYYTTKYLELPAVREAAMAYAKAPLDKLPDDVKTKCGL